LGPTVTPRLLYSITLGAIVALVSRGWSLGIFTAVLCYFTRGED
jgi:hypothetical protein